MDSHDLAPTTTGTEVHVTCKHVTFDDSALESAMATLSDDERQQFGRLHFHEDRCTYAAAHDLLRRCLSRCVPIEPARWRFERTEQGKPFISPSTCGLVDSCEPPAFNLSHTRGLVACAISPQVTVGVDVERADRLRDALDLAEHFFSPVEIAGLRNCRDEAALVTEFIELWTLKEAFLKGTGRGLSLGLNTMTFDLSVRGSVAFRPPVTFDAAEWHFALFEPTPPTRLAVAARAARRPRFIAESIDGNGTATLSPIRMTSQTRSQRTATGRREPGCGDARQKRAIRGRRWRE